LFEPTALYLLSAESCPAAATKEAIKRAKKGEQITAKVAKEIKAKHVPQEEEGDEEGKTRNSQDSLSWNTELPSLTSELVSIGSADTWLARMGIDRGGG
jgi:TusA-related sulfurtransferase